MKLLRQVAVMLQTVSSVMLSKKLETILNIMWRNMKILNQKMTGLDTRVRNLELYGSECENLEVRMSITIYGNDLVKIQRTSMVR